MTEKVGRNDPCPCGSGKKYKQCCIKKSTETGIKKKIKAVWVNKPNQGVNLMERTFGQAISDASQKTPSFLTPPSTPPEEGANLSKQDD
jgi:uncharacterized protein